MKQVVNLEKLGITVKNIIGSGSDGVVVKAITPSCQVIAVKIISIKNQIKKEKFNNEAELMMRLASNQTSSHSANNNIVRVTSFSSLDRDFGIIKMEYLPFDLMTYFTKNQISFMTNEKMIKQVFRGMCEAVVYCHSKEVIHFDIKPENFLFDPVNNKVKLCDFHRSIYFPHFYDQHRNQSVDQLIAAITMLIPVCYRAPELSSPQFDDDDEFDDYDLDVNDSSEDRLLFARYEQRRKDWLKKKFMQSDVWSLGISLFGFFFGVFPFSPVTSSSSPKSNMAAINYDYEELKKFIQCSASSPSWTNIPRHPRHHHFHLHHHRMQISESAQDLLLQLLSPPSLRIPSSSLLSHPFFH